MQMIDSIAELEALYGQPVENATTKELDHLIPEYRAYIEASPFVALATVGPEGLDCSPRGDGAGFVRIQDDKTLLLPDRMGNNRADSLRNIIRDPRVALLFLVPGIGNTLRVNGRAGLTIEPDMLQSFAVDGRAPRSVMVVQIEAVYFQCARALVRSRLWDPDLFVDPSTLPTAGQMLAAASEKRLGGEAHDRAWPERAQASLW
jgi:PPOX class probable FMN-dependent enzyme